MNGLDLRVMLTFPEPAYSALSREAFADYRPSRLLAEVLSDEAAARERLVRPAPDSLRIGAFEDDRLVAWTYARPQGAQLHMINSGVASAFRRRGIYSRLVQMTVEHAHARGHFAVVSRHAANNNAVILAKLRLGFFVSGFEYSEVYGPLVQMTCLTGERRRSLYRARAAPIRRAEADDAA